MIWRDTYGDWFTVYENLFFSKLFFCFDILKFLCCIKYKIHLIHDININRLLIIINFIIKKIKIKIL